MGFFRQMGNAMARFMYGRNGMDQLNRALLALYLILYLVRTLVILVFRNALLARIADILLWVLVVLILFRMISKNLPRRRQENQKWMGWWWKIRRRRAGARARHADKEHKYFTCKNCKTICRVPVGKGKIIITCPKCGAQIHAKS